MGVYIVLFVIGLFVFGAFLHHAMNCDAGEQYHFDKEPAFTGSVESVNGHTVKIRPDGYPNSFLVAKSQNGLYAAQELNKRGEPVGKPLVGVPRLDRPSAEGLSDGIKMRVRRARK